MKTLSITLFVLVTLLVWMLADKISEVEDKISEVDQLKEYAEFRYQEGVNHACNK